MSIRTLTRAGAVAVVVFTGIALTACGGGSSSGGSASGSRTVTIATDSDPAPTGYDPLLYAQGQFSFYAGLYDALFVTDKDGTVKPSLVTDTKLSDDKTKLTLTLRQGVTFTDGSTLDGELVKKNLDRRSDAKLTSYGVFAKGGAAEITDVTASDAKTVVITFAKPQASAQNNLADTAGVIVGAKGVADPASLATTPDGSGPYTLDAGKTTKPSTYTLVKNAKAWNAASYPFDTVVVKTITDPQARANAVVSGQVDVTQLDPATADFAQSRTSVVKNGGTITGFAVFDKLGKTNKAFADPRVRLALTLAIDRKTIADTLHKGAQPTSNMFPSGSPGYDPAVDTQFAYDQAKAEQLLTDAGYGQGFSIDMSVLGQPNTDMVAVQKQWQAIGVTLNFKVVTSTDALFAAVNTQPVGYIQLAIPDALGIVQGVLYGGFMNLQKATDPKIEAALNKAAGATGDAKAAALKELNAAIIGQGWFIPMYEAFSYMGYNAKKVKAPAWGGIGGPIVLASVQPV